MTTIQRHPDHERAKTGASRARSCAHEGCGCAPTDPHSDHCSAYCANVDTEEPDDGACACGHLECAQARREAESDSRARHEVVTAMGHRTDAR
jgi:hypothetical protein